MQIILNNERFYINLPKRLYIELIEFDKSHERMDLDLAVLILHFIIKHQSEPQEWVPLSSVILRKYDHGKYKASEQIRLLEEGGFIEYLNHQNNISGKLNSSRKFRISMKYFQQGQIKDTNEKKYHTYDLKQQPLLKRIKKHNKLRRVEADSTTSHLTNWLKSDNFTIETQAALKYIGEQYCQDTHKYMKRLEKIDHFDPAQSYSRDGKDDRLHSIFTQLPSDLKKFVRYKSQPLVEIDIKSSQPIMFALLLEKFLAHYYELKKSSYGATEGRLKNRILKTLKKWINNNEVGYYKNSKYALDLDKISYSITIILLKTLKVPDFTAIQDFISLVRSGTIYEYLGELVFSMEMVHKKENLYYTRLYNKVEGIQEDFSFDSLRKCAKKIMINVLYSPEESKISVVRAVKHHFLSVFKIVDAFKITDYKDFSLVLQRMEAKFVLDHCSNNIAKKFPDMPLIARHDSLSTTEQFGDTLIDEFNKQIERYFGTNIEIDKDDW